MTGYESDVTDLDENGLMSFELFSRQKSNVATWSCGLGNRSEAGPDQHVRLRTPSGALSKHHPFPPLNLSHMTG
jgi:hypothetical protein